MHLNEPEYANKGLTLIRMPEEFEGEFAIPEGVREIADSAFIHCTNLTAVILPTTLERIGEYAFKLCKSLESIDIPDSVTEIGRNAFWMCHSLSKVKLSANLSKIESETFRETAIEEIEIPNNVKLIEYQAFGDCYYLQDIQLPNDIEIADSAFEGCGGLTAVDAVYLDLYGNPHYKLVKVFPHAFHYSIPDDVVEIGNNVLEDCVNIDSVVVPDSVKKIHAYAFAGSKIKRVKIGNGVTELPDSCFSHCELLEEIDIPDSISSIGQSCFSGCIKLQSVKLGNGVTELPNNCFSECESLEEVDIPDSISYIGQSCFRNCISIRSMQLPDNVSFVCKECFRNCKNLQNITLGNSLKIISVEAFAGCQKLTKISLPQSMNALGNKAFYNCSSLEFVDYSGNVSIGIDSFLGTLVKDSYLLPDFKYYGKILPSQWKTDTPPGKTMLKVYRGICVENADTVEPLIKDIKENGLYLKQLTEKFKVTKYGYKDNRGHKKLTKEELDNLYSNKLSLETASVGFGRDQVYFGDYICAMNYAEDLFSQGSIPIIIEAEMSLDELNIDGVDSFAHIFNPYSNNCLVRDVFSEKVEMYYEKYRAEVNNYDGEDVMKFRNAIINMAESDNDIVYSFYKNNRVIHGKWSNIFKCAFQAKLPISPERILSVKVVSHESLPSPDLYLSDFYD